MEKIPQYELRRLYPLYYMYLGSLAATVLAPDNEWRETYEERLEEIKQEILENGGTLDNNQLQV